MFYLGPALLLALMTLAQGTYQHRASGLDATTLRSDSRVAVSETADYWLFAPVARGTTAAMVFIPGASVEPTAYAPLARDVARSGYKTYVLKLPPPSGPLDAHKASGVAKAKAVISADRSVQRWLVAGHSLGGAIAAQFVRENPDLVAGYVLIGTTHPTVVDLSSFDLDATKVVATEDPIASEAKSRNNAQLLPKTTRWVRVEGGNHSQFAWYERQQGDGAATISRDRQQEITTGAILAALSRIAGRANGR
jgi:poly(3-hydroxybutyrate) depolymerase